MLPIQFRFADEPPTTSRKSSDVDCVFSTIAQNYFIIEPLKIFPTPPRCPLLESIWDISAPTMVSGANLPMPSFTVDWQTQTPIWKNQVLFFVPVAVITLSTLAPTATGKATARVPHTTFTWAYVSEFSGSVPLTESVWTVNNPVWAPCRPLPKIPLHSITWTTLSPRIYREPNLTAVKRGAVIYSAELTGDTGIELPIASFQARVNNNNYSYLSVVVPNIDLYLEEIQKRENGYLIIKRGYRWSDGTRQLDELVRTKFEDYTYDVGAKNSSGTLRGYYAAVQTSDRPRTLNNISYTNISKGKRRYRCDVDTFLRPGGLAIANSQFFTVGEITYTVSTNSAVMEVVEA